jgi:phage baseplate assembly protein gpV
VEISGAGTVFAGYAVAGTVDVTAANVTVRDDKITATGDTLGVAIRHASNVTIEDCDISSPSAGAGRLMVGSRTSTATPPAPRSPATTSGTPRPGCS